VAGRRRRRLRLALAWTHLCGGGVERRLNYAGLRLVSFIKTLTLGAK
jgi:hypothetical protein